MDNKKKKFIFIFAIIIISIITILVCIKLLPFLISLQEETNRIKFQNYVNELGYKGVLLLILLQVIQIFIAFIPGEIIELLAGLLYGTWQGLLICLIGNAIASLLIYLTVRLFTKNHLLKFKNKFKQYSFLNNKKKIAIYLFIIYLIPGIPKDIVTYLIPFLPINFITFIVVTSVARIPSIISSTYSSNSFLNNNYLLTILILVIFAILAILGFAFKDRILTKLKKDNDKDNGHNTSK